MKDQKYFEDAAIQNDTLQITDFDRTRGSEALPLGLRRFYCSLLGDAVRGAILGNLEDQAWILDTGPRGAVTCALACDVVGVEVRDIRRAILRGDTDPDEVRQSITHIVTLEGELALCA